MVQLLDLPLEILKLIATFLPSQSDVNALSQTNRIVNYILIKYLYSRNAEEHSGSALIWACQEGIISTARHALQAGAKPNTLGRTKCPALATAAAYGHVDIVRLLLSQDVIDPDQRDLATGQTALSKAAENGHDAIIGLLLMTKGVDPNSAAPLITPAWGDTEAWQKMREQLGWTGKTPLAWAAERGHFGAVKLLLEDDRVRPDILDREGFTPLLLAAARAPTAVVQLLLAHRGVDANFRERHNGHTALAIAAINGNEGAVRQLLSNPSVDRDRPNIRGATPIFHATRNGHDAIVQLLLTYDDKLPLIEVKSQKYHPIIAAMERRDDRITQIFLELDTNHSGREIETNHRILLTAARTGYDQVAQALLSTDIDKNCRNAYHRTPLISAAKNGHDAVVAVLLAGGADVNCRDQDGWTALSHAAYNGHETVVSLLLLQNGINVHCKDFDDETPLSRAADRCHESIMVQLLKYPGVDFNFRSAEDKTPLLLAAQAGCEEAAKLLVSSGAVDPDAKSVEGLTPLMCTSQAGSMEIVSLLLATKRVDLMARDSASGMTAAGWASFYGEDAIAELLNNAVQEI
ncbi:ankyrin repeat-containing domain protein [Xylogone sp. PMI_703]|nr:ankyrin repeat-containing domain protein [Xylogone sp. PMI_703]